MSLPPIQRRDVLLGLSVTCIPAEIRDAKASLDGLPTHFQSAGDPINAQTGAVDAMFDGAGSGFHYATLAGAQADAVSGDAPVGTIVTVYSHGVAGDQGGIVGIVQAADSAANPNGGRIKPLCRVLYPGMFGAAGDGATDDSAALQAMLDFCGANDARFMIDGVHRLVSPLTIQHHGLTGGRTSNGKLVWEGAGAALRSARIGGIYPLNCDLEFSVELTAANQIGWDWRLSYSRGRLLAGMNDPACTNCAGMRLMGDVPAGSGSYYNHITLRGQAAHQGNTHLIRTEPDDGDLTGLRGPNANTVVVERAGQYNAALLDKAGDGNTFYFRAVEGDGASGRNAVLAGHDSNITGVTQNTYHIAYLESVEAAFRSVPGTFGSSNRIILDMATGGGAIIDDAGILTSRDGVLGFERTAGSLAPLVLRGKTPHWPRIAGPSSAALVIDDEAGEAVELRNSDSFSANYFFRLIRAGAEHYRFGTTIFSPVVDAAKSLGAAAARWTTVYASTGTINTSDAREKITHEGEEDELLRLAGAAASVPLHAFQWTESVERKGADGARIHVGVYAQEVEAALRAAGLDPARYALWCKDMLYDEVEGEDGALEQRPRLDESGEHAYRLGVRHDQLAAISLLALKLADQRRQAEITALTERHDREIRSMQDQVSALLARVEALENT